MEQALEALPAPPADRGTVVLVVARPGREERATPSPGRLTPEGGVEGDRWGLNAGAGSLNQITVMRADIARMMGPDAPLTLPGDNLMVDLDLSESNLPAGTRLRVGGAVCEVTPHPHTGCGKFASRYGQDALELTRDHNAMRLRGLHVRVIEAGEVAPGDSIAVLSRHGSN